MTVAQIHAAISLGAHTELTKSPIFTVFHKQLRIFMFVIFLGRYLCGTIAEYVLYAGLAELVDATHSKCVVERRAGSSPASGTEHMCQ